MYFDRELPLLTFLRLVGDVVELDGIVRIVVYRLVWGRPGGPVRFVLFSFSGCSLLQMDNSGRRSYLRRLRFSIWGLGL